MDGSFAQRLQMISIQIVPFLMAVVFHEFGHGWMAKRWGDTTAHDSGRLTLNPIPHLDPIGTVLFPLLNMITGIPLLFGWARPVPINPRRFRKYRPGLFWVSLAGPLSNFLLAGISGLAMAAVLRFAPVDFSLREPLFFMCQASIGINFALAFFNLIPLPPLDGGRVVESFASYHATQTLRQVERYSFVILLVLMWSGGLTYLIGGPITFCTNLVIGLSARVFGLAV